jgi:kynurenine formamidase
VLVTGVPLPSDQVGTQLDPPAHWNELGATISDVPPTVALRPLVVIDLSEATAADQAHQASRADVEAWEAEHGVIPRGAAVLFRTDWSRKWSEYSEELPATFPGVGLDALQFLHLERGILVHGHEPLDTDMTPSLEGEAWLMHENFLQIEGATNLHLLPPTGCLLSIGFAKVLGGAGGYARLVAICPSDWKHGVSVQEASGAPLAAQPAPLRRGPDGVLRPTPGAEPTKYCDVGSGALGCPPTWDESGGGAR